MSTLTKDPSGTSYRYAPASNIEVEVGDALQAEFEPQVKLARWNNECNFSLRFQLPGGGRAGVSTADTKIIWERGDYRAIFYDAPEASNEGGFEFEIHLGKRPPTNQFSFTYNSKEVVFDFQPALTQKEVEMGCHRPDPVIGSYAIYHRSKRNGLYMVGKVCHLYRPHAVDAKGDETWGTVSISDPDANGSGTVIVSIPQDWLFSAAYPVVIDPTFGYTGEGASDSSHGVAEWVGLNTQANVTGLVDSIHASVASSAFADVKAIFCNASKVITDNGIGGTATGGFQQTWLQMNYSSKPSSVNSTFYWPGFTGSDSFRAFYDSGATGAVGTVSSYTFPDNPSGVSEFSRKYSIYVTATAQTSGRKSLTLLGVG